MSGSELLAVVICVATICSAYQDGAELVQQIKAKRKAKNALQQEISSQRLSTSELELSLNRGVGVVRRQYERAFKRFGASFATGDRVSQLPFGSKSDNADLGLEIARDSLKDIIIHLQHQVISTLKAQWQQDTVVDFNVLQDVSDVSQDRAMLVLMQLEQRIIASGPIEEHRQPPPFLLPDPSNNPTSAHQTSPLSPSSPLDVSNGLFTKQQSYSPSEFLRQPSTIVPGAGKKSHFTAMAKISFFKRPKAEHIPKSFDSAIGSKILMGRVQTIQTDQKDQQDLGNPTVSVYDASLGLYSNYRQRPAVEAIEQSPPSQFLATSTHGACEPATPDFNPWTIQRSPSPSLSSHNFFSSQELGAPNTLDTVVPAVSINQKDLLPCEANKFAGFCKGAWRLQTGDRKKAMEERQRPGGMYNTNRYWQCSRCKFEGHMVIHDRASRGFDEQIYSTEGIQFRWEFLFKSHVESKEATPNPLRANFGCIFCFAEGKGTPTFGGIESFINHIQEHREHLPSGEVLNRMNCVVGRHAEPKDNFDINLISKVSGI